MADSIHIKNTTIQLNKRYYSIGEVSKMFGVANSLIRFWEGEFPTIKPNKNKNGDRQFTNKDILNIKAVYTLVKERGFTIEGAKKELKNNISTKQTKVVSLIDKLSSLKEELIALKKEL